MLQAGCELSVLLKAPAHIRIDGLIGSKDFYRDLTIEQSVVSPVNDGTMAFAHHFSQSIPPRRLGSPSRGWWPVDRGCTDVMKHIDGGKALYRFSD
jgi:hypothetical protein